MNFENQPSSLPNVKPVVAAIMTLVVYHYTGPFIPADVLGAWAVVIEYAISVLGGLLAAYPFRDFAGKPLQEEDKDV